MYKAMRYRLSVNSELLVLFGEYFEVFDNLTYQKSKKSKPAAFSQRGPSRRNTLIFFSQRIDYIQMTRVNKQSILRCLKRILWKELGKITRGEEMFSPLWILLFWKQRDSGLGLSGQLCLSNWAMHIIHRASKVSLSLSFTNSWGHLCLCLM